MCKTAFVCNFPLNFVGVGGKKKLAEEKAEEKRKKKKKNPLRKRGVLRKGFFLCKGWGVFFLCRGKGD